MGRRGGRVPYSLRGHSQHSNSYQPRKNILQREIKSPRGFLALCLGSGGHSQAGYPTLFPAPRDLSGLGDQGQLRTAHSLVPLAVFPQSLLCHGLHKLGVVPGDFFWDSHHHGVGIEEFQDHLCEARGNAGVGTVGRHLEGAKVRKGLNHWAHLATKVRLQPGLLTPWLLLISTCGQLAEKKCLNAETLGPCKCHRK